jgi:imidazole glycerol-phosphate synthase subunit HisH
MGNLGSVKNMLLRVGTDAEIIRTKEELLNAEKLILPGVGSFDAAMQNLEDRDLVGALNKKVVEDGIPLLGICLGMQLLLDSSEEGVKPGLGWIQGSCRRFEPAPESGLKVPHMGWNNVRFVQEHAVSKGLNDASEFYFVHSFYVECAESRDVLAVCEHGQEFHCALKKDNIVAAQFHPEKSLKNGMAFMLNFSEWMP